MQNALDTSHVPTMTPASGVLRMKRLPPWHNKRSSAKKSA
jgi:hypothetical protein